MMSLLRRRLRLRSSDEGIAMIMVISVGAVLTLLIVSAVALSVSAMKRSSTDSGWNAALAAAYAGVEEYQSRLTDEPAYVKYGNPASTFSNPTNASNPKVQLPTGVKANPAFGLGPTGTWATVPVADGDDVVLSGAKYRYEVDNLKYADTGTIRLRSTGMVNGQARTIVADLRQKGFIDYIYFTDLEMSDPAIVGGDCQSIYLYNGRDADCTIQFAAGDTLGGPVHSNDTLVMCGATTFKGVVTTGNPAGGYKKASNTCVGGNFAQGQPVYSPTRPIPTSNGAIKKETRTDLQSTDVPRPGCLYTGPTSITLLSGGLMNVRSPWTKFVGVVGDPNNPTAGDNSFASQCGAPADLQSAGGATIRVLDNNVAYVQNIPLTGVNGATEAQTTGAATGSGTTTNSAACLKANTTPATKLKNTEGYSQNVIGYPLNTEKPLVGGTAATASYGCRNGDVFIKGDMTGGGMTIAADNYIYVTGDIKYGNPDTDILGLIGNNAVWVYNPMTSSNNMVAGYTSLDRRIDAAILSVAHTFIVQNYANGPSRTSPSYGRGTLTVNGSIAQKYRGPVATTGGTGYSKNYTYDTRFRYAAPPRFLSPVTTTYGINVWVEVNPVFNANGSYK